MTDLDQFKATYITESFELLEEMEEKLLGLDEGEVDVEELNAIFRCAHSIKGGGGAFGFNQLVEFTHVVEFLLDAMREGKITATQDITDALLKSVDVISQLISAAQEGKNLPDDFGSGLVKELKKICELADRPIADKKTEDKKTQKSDAKEVGLYKIKFIPRKNLFASGNEPLLIIRELKKLGDVSAKVDYSCIPHISDIDPEDCYMEWQMEISTDKDTDEVKEVFEFVEGECELEIFEFGAVSLSSNKEEKAEEDFGGVFDGAMEALSGEKQKSQEIKPEIAEVNKQKIQAVTSIRVDIEKVDNLVNMVGELVITQAMISQQMNNLSPDQFHGLIQGVGELSRHIRELQEAVMAVRMQPVKSIFSRMPRIVRDLSRQLGKDIEIVMSGENTEIDKTVIEQLGDPLTHMIRNSVDHGIETPEERTKAGKPAKGTITLTADNSGGRIIIDIEDDGKGINRERVLKKAKQKGLIAEDAALTDEEIDRIIFMAGFSTAEQVTNVSGRGVGMDVVKRNIGELGGTIEMENNPGAGSKFSVSLPLTLAILDGMIIRVTSEHYIIPINNIIESLSPSQDAIKHVADGGNVLNVRGEFVPILYLRNVFSSSDKKPEDGRTLVILVESGRDKVGLVVDEIVGQQQVVIKSLERNSERVDGFSGATILGDGKVSLILDIAKLHKITLEGQTKEKEAA